MKVLVLGASGMLGNAVLRLLSASDGYEVFGSVRSAAAVRLLPAELRDRIVTGVDVENQDSLAALLGRVRPDAVINCVGIVKQLQEASDPLTTLPINAMLPHRLARMCDLVGARLVHVSTDCVFTGAKGMYLESDLPDAIDLYGRSKSLGEVDYPHAVTLRTSIIGHELGGSAHGLVEWFLAQKDQVKGFTKAIFSGLPTVELAAVIRDRVLPAAQLRGVYHVSAAPIDKHSLLNLLAQAYGRLTRIVPDGQLVIDRSLDSSRFRSATGYQPPAWPELVRRMAEFR
ncbi:dTDP-4-dehydrorhamnose reductase family protein [Ramlibacter sp. Leaf400]|uniref:dTDP-4-dehydrorhamnose reductase family protein n=1 Tax=Ramlibacter sp. Leaf400 TaxID=1736365 RepID=UPI0006F95CE0|nr:SDR family oxidoreductase [Ramlibacter sp. Leaf400]KQT14365.1 NAD(P)-dependent oxidoreductase [Ramlibacter sp. Leaf400]